eukprot:GHVS01014931.1.p1 GENE.GHVS01014931.1~~GHVS01014931.1.p1  ORF type:complete len:158 (+),score=5.73 GHVS01014931.1:171-644(+)
MDHDGEAMDAEPTVLLRHPTYATKFLENKVHKFPRECPYGYGIHFQTRSWNKVSDDYLGITDFFAITHLLDIGCQVKETLEGITKRNPWMNEDRGDYFVGECNNKMNYLTTFHDRKNQETDYLVFQVDGKKLHVVKPKAYWLVPMNYSMRAAMLKDA